MGYMTRLGALTDENRRAVLVLGLTFATGAVDSVSYFSLNHTFTANMSGNMALLGIGIATHFGPVAGNLFAFMGFVLGSVAGPRLLRAQRGSRLALAARMLVVEVALLALIACVLATATVGGHPALRDAVCVGLAFAMAIQTTVARHLNVTDVNTTVATMTLHDLVAASPLAGGQAERWRRRVGVIVTLVAGAAIGIALEDNWHGTGLALACVTVLSMLVLCTAWALLDAPALAVEPL